MYFLKSRSTLNWLFRGRAGSFVWMVLLLAPAPAALAQYQAPGYSAQTVSPGAAALNAGIAFSPSGTLYDVQGPLNFGASTSNTIEVSSAPYTSWTQVTLPVNLYNPSGVAWDANTNSLLVADNVPQTSPTSVASGVLYSVAISGSSATVSTIFTYANDPNLQQVAVQPVTGNILVSDAYLDNSGNTNGSIFQVGSALNQNFDRVAGPNPNYVINPGATLPLTSSTTGPLTYTAGMSFDSSGNLVFNQLDANFTGRAYSVPLTNTAGELSANLASIKLLSPDAGTASSDLAVTTGGGVFTSGSGGLFQVANLTSSLFNNDGNGDNQFATSLAYLAGVGSFSPGAGSAGGILAYVPEYNSSSIVLITAVPEPSSWALLTIGAGGMLVARRWRRTRRER